MYNSTSYCEKKDIYLQSINGYTDHLHCLISLGKDQSIAQVARLIKGESSHWINKNQLIAEKFIWQDDYFAVSVSESQVAKVILAKANWRGSHIFQLAKADKESGELNLIIG